jgi:ferredoxin
MAAVSITADGKTFQSSEKTVNLRKELQKNGIDVYPLRSKITGNCGGAGICGKNKYVSK